jgi:hypothetical protein
MPKFFRSNPTFSTEALAAPKVAALGGLSGVGGVGANAALAGNAASASLGSAAAINAAAAHSVLPSAIFPIEVGQAPVQPILLRGGKTITAPVFNLKAVEDYNLHTVPILHTKVPVAVSQSIPAGTQVAKGTPVDIVFAAVTDIPYSIFDHFHPDLANRTVADLLPLVTNPKISPLLDKDEATLTGTDKETLLGALAAQNIGVVESDTARNLSAALKSLRDTQAFA